MFLKGCPARCPWCHNPESQSFEPELIMFPERCVACGSCRAACTNGTDPERCTACGACAVTCPADARQVAGTTMTAAEVVERAARDRRFYDESGGGITFSGGEPFAQPAFLRSLLIAARDARLSTAIDTCGFASSRLLTQLTPLVDLFLFDLKMTDPVRHRVIVGLPLAPILDNLHALGTAGANVWLRVPIVPSFTDDRAGLEHAARVAAGNPSVRRVYLLPYHATGSGKFRRLRRPYGMEAIDTPSPVRMEELANIFRARGLDTRVGG